MKFFDNASQAYNQIKEDPKSTVRTLRQYNSELSSAAILVSGLNALNQFMGDYGLMPALSSAATIVLFNAAFWTNDLVLSGIEKMLPAHMKDVVAKVEAQDSNNDEQQVQLEEDLDEARQNEISPTHAHAM